MQSVDKPQHCGSPSTDEHRGADEPAGTDDRADHAKSLRAADWNPRWGGGVARLVFQLYITYLPVH